MYFIEGTLPSVASAVFAAQTVRSNRPNRPSANLTKRKEPWPAPLRAPKSRIEYRISGARKRPRVLSLPLEGIRQMRRRARRGQPAVNKKPVSGLRKDQVAAIAVRVVHRAGHRVLAQ